MRATRLYALLDCQRFPKGYFADFTDRVSKLRRRLGMELFATVWVEGQAMSLEQAVAYALHDESQEGYAPVDEELGEAGIDVGVRG